MTSIPSGGKGTGVGDILGPLADLKKAKAGEGGEGDNPSATPPKGGEDGPNPLGASMAGGMLGSAQSSVNTAQGNLANTAQAQQATTASSANSLTGMSQDIAKGADGKKSPPSGSAAATGGAIPGATTQ